MSDDVFTPPATPPVIETPIVPEIAVPALPSPIAPIVPTPLSAELPVALPTSPLQGEAVASPPSAIPAIQTPGNVPTPQEPALPETSVRPVERIPEPTPIPSEAGRAKLSPEPALPETSVKPVESTPEPTVGAPADGAAKQLPDSAAPSSPPSSDVAPSKPATSAADKPPETAAADAQPADPPIEPATTAAEMVVTLNLTICDFAGKPIGGLKYKVTAGKENYSGATNDQGQIAEIGGLVPNEALEFFVLKSDGTYVSKYQGLVACGNMNMCAVSPHIKISLETEPHKGPPGPPAVKPPKPAAVTAPVAPLAGGIVGGGKHPPLTTVSCRNDVGHPSMSLTEKTADWAKRHGIPTLGLWNWEDFKPKATACTVPAVAPHAPPPAHAVAAAAHPAAPTVAAAAHPPSPAVAAATHPAAPAAAPRHVAAPIPTASTPTVGRPNAVSAAQTMGPASVTSANQAVPVKVTRLMAIMEEQCLWEWKTMFSAPISLSSAEVKVKILNGTFIPVTGKDPTKTNGRCYPSVKVGLWRAELVTGYGIDIPAKGAGAWLLQQGFHDVLSSIPDARWALPGDVIVYRYSDAYESANTEKHAAALAAYEAKKKKYDATVAELPEKLHLWKEEEEEAARRAADAKKNKQKIHKAGHHPKPAVGAPPHMPDDENWGHIDVRTYDGYISDFKSIRLPDLQSRKPMVVLGVYRKVYDPMPDLRVRAFLKVLREFECHGIDDKDRYFRLQNKIDGKITFTDTSTHPRKNIGGEGTFAGAYQISLGTYEGQVKKGLPSDFSPANQDRLAVSIIEGRGGNPLGKIRQGNIEGAVRELTSEWSSLPGGVDCRHEMRGKQNYRFTMADLVERYNIFLNELIGK